MSFDYFQLRDDRNYRAELTDWVREDEALRDDGRLLFKTNLLAACYILGYTKIDPVVHKEAIEFFIVRDLSKPMEEQGQNWLTRGTLLLPRGSYKTTLDEVDTVQEVASWPERCSVFLMCGNQDLAHALVENVGGHFIKNPDSHPTLFHALFPELCISSITRRKQRAGTFTAGRRQMNPPIREAAVMGFSVEQGASGWHCWRLKCDDMANNRNQGSESAQQKVLKNYRINRKMLMAGGIEDKLGTRYGPNDPYGMELKAARPGSYRYVNKPALRLLSGERLDSNGFPPREEMELLFESIGLTYEILRDEYEQDYESFMTQYLNDDYGANEVVFTREQLHEVLLPEPRMPLDGEVHMHWRLPYKGAGWIAAAGAVGILEHGRMYVVDAVHGSWKPSLLAAKIVEFARRHHCHSIAVEESPGARQAEPVIRNYALQRGHTLHIQWMEPQDPAEREQRIRSAEPLFTARRLLLSEGITSLKKTFEQFTSFGMLADDALPDVISRVADNLPVSIAREDMPAATHDDFQAAMERDRFNTVFSAPAFASPVPEPALEDEVELYETPANPWGLEDIMPGLQG